MASNKQSDNKYHFFGAFGEYSLLSFLTERKKQQKKVVAQEFFSFQKITFRLKRNKRNMNAK